MKWADNAMTCEMGVWIVRKEVIGCLVPPSRLLHGNHVLPTGIHDGTRYSALLLLRVNAIESEYSFISNACPQRDTD